MLKFYKKCFNCSAEDFMKKSFSFLCSAILSLLVFSCAEVRTSSVSVKIPESVARAVTEGTSDDTDFTLVVKISGDYSLEKSFKIEKSVLSSPQVFTIEDLPVGAKISMEVSLLQGSVAYYKTSEAANLTLAAGENSANVELERVTGKASIKNGELDIFVDGSEIEITDETEVPTVSFDKTVVLYAYTDLPVTSYIWTLNGTKILEQTEAERFDCTFSQLDGVFVGAENVISCMAVTDENLTKISEFRFILTEEDSGE